MRKIIIGILFAAICALGLAPSATAEPDGDRTPALDTIDQTDRHYVEPSVPSPAMAAQIHTPTIIHKGEYAPSPAISGKETMINNIAIAATDIGSPWAFAHNTGPRKGAKPKGGCLSSTIDIGHHASPCT